MVTPAQGFIARSALWSQTLLILPLLSSGSPQATAEAALSSRLSEACIRTALNWLLEADILLASTTAGLPDWDLPSLRSFRDVTLSGSFCHFWFVPVAFQQDMVSLHSPGSLGTRYVDKAGLTAGIKAMHIMPSPGAFLSCQGATGLPAVEFFSSFLDSWPRPRDSWARLITFTSPLGL